MTVQSDIEIARAATMKPIAEVASKVAIPGEALVLFGTTKAKISFDYINSLKDRPDGKLILVTAISPTPAANLVLKEGRANPSSPTDQTIMIAPSAGNSSHP